MEVLLVVCDSQDAANVSNAIRGFGEFLRLSRSSFLLATDTHADAVWSELRRRETLMAPDSLLVLSFERTFKGPITEEVQSWLERVSGTENCSRS
jgi:hypothetical protein